MNRLRIAFVSSHPSVRRFRRDASFIYRCENLGAGLSELGHYVTLLHLKALLFRRDFDIVVFMRPARSRLFDFIVHRLRKRGVTLIGDVDDLLFDPECAKFRPSVLNGSGGEEETRDKFELHASALAQMDKVQFSVAELARRYLILRPSAYCTVIPNAAHHSWRSIQAPSSPTEQRISYFSGTRTHDRDLAIVTPVLGRLLQRHPQLVVQLVGPVNTTLEHPRLQRIGKVSFLEYAELVRTSHVCIAPLEDTPFNQCKSALKAIEAAAFNVPIVVSPVGEFGELRMTGVLHARSNQDWEAQLEYVLDAARYKQLSAGLRERMAAYTDIQANAEKFLSFAVQGRAYEIAAEREICKVP